MKSLTDAFEYRLKREIEKIEGLELTIESLANLDETIDALFEFLRQTGRESLLEELCPYFGVIWPSARALSEYLVAQDDTLKGSRLLEVGCGLAIPSLAAAMRGAKVTATDFHPEVSKFLERNQMLNSVNTLQYLHLDWQRTALTEVISEKFDWVVGSDILYERQQPTLVAQVMSECLAEGGKAVLADPGRPYLQTFVDEMTRRGFQYQTQVRTVNDRPVNKDIFLLVFERSINA